MNHIEITVEEHEAYVAAVAERDTLLAKLAEDEPFTRLGRWAASMVGALSDARPADESRAAAINAFIDAHARQRARIEELEREVAKANAAPVRIVLDHGPPTEPGWYLYTADGVHCGTLKMPEERRVLTEFCMGRFSRRIVIVVPESEVGE